MFIAVMIELGYTGELSKSWDKEEGIFTITYNRNTLLEVVITRTEPLSKYVELIVQNIGNEKLDKILKILDALEEKFRGKLEFTFTI